LFFSRRYPDAKILSLEPDQNNFDLLKKNTANYPTVTAIQSALWDKEGSIEIMDKGYGVRGFVVEEGTGNSANSMLAVTMSVLMRKFNITSIDILKMDIEGSEREVFSSGAEKWLPITKCLIIELHDRMKPGCSQAVFKALSNYNFECAIKGENLVFVNKNLQ
jgi:FkbM family methyltransferase